MDSILLEPYNERWKHTYEKMKNIIETIIGDNAISIHHIGSTSIPGILAKPVIDILAIVRDLNILDNSNSEFEKNEFIPKGENGTIGRRYFIRRENGIRIAHLHCHESNHPDIKGHFLFQKYLIKHPMVAEEYSKLKSMLAEKHRDDRLSYTNSKSDFIRTIIEKALHD